MDIRTRLLRKVAARLTSDSSYQWGHMGMCNCGHLARAIRDVSEHEIHRAAMQRGAGDWAERARDYCPDSGFLIDDIIGDILSAGFSLRDIEHLERLSDSRIRERIYQRGHKLSRNRRKDVVAYLLAWAELLEMESAELAA